MERVNVWKYKPRDKFKNKEEVFNFKDTLGNPFVDDFKRFFKNEEIQELVKDNNWLKIVENWINYRHLNQPGWVIPMLLDALYWLDIDFWSYIPELFDPNSWSLGNFYKEN